MGESALHLSYFESWLIFCVYFLTLADHPEERLPFLKLISVATEIHKEIISFSGKTITVM